MVRFGRKSKILIQLKSADNDKVILIAGDQTLARAKWNTMYYFRV